MSRRAQKMGKVVIIGGSVLDIQAWPTTERDVQTGVSAPGKIAETSGGVGRNIAHCLCNLVGRDPENVPQFVSLVGQDYAGSILVHECKKQGIPVDNILQIEGVTTPKGVMIFNHAGDVAGCVVSASAIEEEFTVNRIERFRPSIESAALLVLDTNLSATSLEYICCIAESAGVPLFLEPVSPAKAIRTVNLLPSLTYISPNLQELFALSTALDSKNNTGCLTSPHPTQATIGSHNSLDVETWLGTLRPHIQKLASAGVSFIVLTLGEHGAALCFLCEQTSELVVKHFPAVESEVMNCSGAGDCLVSGMVWGLSQGCTPEKALQCGQVVASHCLQVNENVPNVSADQVLGTVNGLETKASDFRFPL